MKSYSWQGASPHVSWIPSDQKGVEHFEHVWRVNPCFRNSSTSYSLSGISASERTAALKGSRKRFAIRIRVRCFPNMYRVVKYAPSAEFGRGNCLEERPLTAFILSLLGSVFVIVGTILGFALYSSSPYASITTFMAILTGVSVALGILMLAMTLMLYQRPELHVAWGVAILVFGAGSITTVFSGYGGVAGGGAWWCLVGWGGAAWVSAGPRFGS